MVSSLSQYTFGVVQKHGYTITVINAVVLTTTSVGGTQCMQVYRHCHTTAGSIHLISPPVWWPLLGGAVGGGGEDSLHLTTSQWT